MANWIREKLFNKLKKNFTMTKFNAYEYHTDAKTENFICSNTDLNKCASEAANYVRNHAGLCGDSIETVEENLRNRYFYVCSYGGSSIEIREE